MPEPDSFWKRLPKKVQRLLVIRARKRALQKLSAYTNVTGVGIGLRYAADKRTAHHCITVQVKRKWKHPTKTSVPNSLTAYLTTASGRKRVMIPVDVVLEKHPKLQSGGRACVGRFRQYTSPGTACCLVQLGSDPTPYILSCHHVIYFTKYLEDPEDSTLHEFALLVGTNSNPIGPPEQFFPLIFADAAIVPWPNATPGDELIHGRRLSGWADDDSDIPEQCTIYTKHGPVTAVSAHLLPTQIGGYHGNDSVYEFDELLHCEFIQGRTRAGDSGSPVLDGAGRLIGMHIAGDSRYSYILPIYQILPQFDPTLKPIRRLL